MIIKCKKWKKIQVFVAVALLLATLSCGIWYIFLHDKSYKNAAIERGDGIYLNGVRYWPTQELNEYSVTNVLICKTDTGMKIYEIKEYPDYEYVVGYHAWDGQIYKRDRTGKLE